MDSLVILSPDVSPSTEAKCMVVPISLLHANLELSFNNKPREVQSMTDMLQTAWSVPTCDFAGDLALANVRTYYWHRSVPTTRVFALGNTPIVDHIALVVLALTAAA